MRSILIFALAACGAFAHAATEGTTGTVKSEYFYQTDANVNQATPALGYTTSTTKPKGGGTEEESTATVLSVNYERGINEMISVGGSLGYVTGKSDAIVADADNKGLDDLRFFVKGNNSFAAGSSLNYGAILNYSLGAKKIEADSTSVNTGGAAITPYVGYQMLMGPNVIGTRLQTGVDVMKAKWDVAGTESDFSGGLRTIWTGFYEANAGGGTWGGELGWWTDSTSKLDTTPVQESAGETGYSLAAYTKYDVSEGAQIVGRLTYESALSDHNNIDSATKYGLNVGGRFTF